MKNKSLVDELINLLDKGNAHVTLDDALEGIPFEKITEQPGNLPYSIWSLTDHLRIAQWDIVAFCKNAEHTSPAWPEGYWPTNRNPSKEDWEKCLHQIRADRKEMTELIRMREASLFLPFEYGSGQTLFREALVLADHNSYHCGQIIAIRRLLGLWEK